MRRIFSSHKMLLAAALTGRDKPPFADFETRLFILSRLAEDERRRGVTARRDGDAHGVRVGGGVGELSSRASLTAFLQQAPASMTRVGLRLGESIKSPGHCNIFFGRRVLFFRFTGSL